MAERLVLPEQPTGIGRFVPGVGSRVHGVKHSAGLDDLDDFADAEPIPGLLIYRIDDELFSANTAVIVEDIKRRLSISEPAAASLLIGAEGMSDIGDDHMFLEVDDAVSDYLNQ